MTHSTRTLLGVSAFALAGCTTLSAFAQAPSAPKTGYLTDSQNSHVMAGNGVECWRTSEWTPALALEPCDPVIKKMVIAQVEPAPKAAPAVVPMAMPIAVATPLPSRINFSADALFGFDKSVIGPEGRKMLDDLSAQLKTANVDVIHVTGHTDRLGSNAYNQKLSERRAQAVREYIVAGGFADNKIDAKGMGETQPVTKPEDCKGKQSAKVIACLQPDRRVDVELQGTQAAKP
jgi:OOP family OmpA-OmpF porin